MNRRLCRVVLVLALAVGLSARWATSADDSASDRALATDAGWPRTLASGDDRLTIYQPQIDKWENNLLEARAAVSVARKASPQPLFGVCWLSARTEVDKENRVVHLDNIKVTKANFPTAADQSQDYLAVLRKSLPQKTQTVALDRLEANLAITQAESTAKKVPLQNEPPRILLSTSPAILVLIDGKPVLRKVDGSKLLRVINTGALFLLDEGSGQYYLALTNRWLQAKSIEGLWVAAQAAPPTLEQAKKTITMNQPVDLLDDLAPDVKQALDKGTLPTIYVSTEPAELIETEGKPQFQPIDGTQLLSVKNTTSQLFLDVSGQNYYVLISGRWFRAKALEGPWEFVPGDKLPADFARVPMNHPKGDVLASVAGTPQAKELMIANQVPQTATVKRSEAKLTPIYDGKPQFEAVPDTQLQYAVNTPTPVLRVGARYYAVENGVWFTAVAPEGPWEVATAVPPAIYQMPPSSPLYYVTNVQVYDSTPETVNVGYTPGYFGSCVAPYGAVVYGTGWRYRPWVGSAWFGRPWTYGFGAGFGWTAAGGWGFGYGAGAGRPWWGPAGWHSGWGGAWRGGWERGYGGRYDSAHFNHVNFNNFNTYNRWGNNAVVNRQGNTHTTNINPTTNVNRTTNIDSQNRNNYVSSHGGDVNQHNNVFAGKDGNVYRQGDRGWETHDGKDWKPAEPRGDGGQRQQELQKEQYGRYAGQQQHQNFQQSGGFAGHNAPRGGGGGGRRR